MRGISCGVFFYHPILDISCAVRVDEFTLVGTGDDLSWIRDLMASWFEIKVMAIWGPEDTDDKEVVILGRTVTWTKPGSSTKLIRSTGKGFQGILA